MQTVNEIIEYLIKNQEEIADMVVSYQTHSGELVISTNAIDTISAVGLMTCAQQVMINRECINDYDDDE